MSLGFAHTPPITARAVRLADASCTHPLAALHTHPTTSLSSCCPMKQISHTAWSCPATDARRHVSCRCRVVGTEVEAGWKDEDFIEVGTLGRPHGVRGEVVVSVDTSFPEQRFASPGVRFVSMLICS